MGATTSLDAAAVVRAFYGLLKQRKVEEAGSLLHEDLVIDEPQELPFGGIFRGRGASAEILEIIGSLSGFAPVGDFEIWGSDGLITKMDIYYTEPGAVAATLGA